MGPMSGMGKLFAHLGDLDSIEIIGSAPITTNLELREDNSRELREDGGQELRD